jgi:hypothetical protein
MEAAALAGARTTYGADHDFTQNRMSALGCAVLNQRKAGEARALFEELLASRKKTHPPDDWLIKQTEKNMGILAQLETGLL